MFSCFYGGNDKFSYCVNNVNLFCKTTDSYCFVSITELLKIMEKKSNNQNCTLYFNLEVAYC